MRAASTACLALSLAWGGCVGQMGSDPAGGDPVGSDRPADSRSGAEEPVVPGPVAGGAASAGLTLMSRVEYDNTVRDLLGDNTRAAAATFPEELTTPDIAFDNDITLQQVSAQLIGAAESLAQEGAARALADPGIRKALVPCAPTGPGDAACLRTVIARFGRRAFRRPLPADEVTRYLTFQSFAVEQNDFYAAVELVVRAMLQDPRFLYRAEVGVPVPGRKGLFKLDGYEMASRLSYFMRGTTPSESLLALAEADALSTPEQIRAAATTLLSDPATVERIQHFHAQWLSYDRLPHPAALASAMQAETRALVQRVVFDRPASSYLELFLSKDTFIDGTLARQYGLPAPARAAWVGYGNTGRMGILSHGSVLSATSNAGDTHPVLRGRYVSTRLMCRPIPPPPAALKAQIDGAPMSSSPCKKDKLIAHAQAPACAGCHDHMDPIGFGLENYDREGTFRTVEAGLPRCAISGEGELPEIGPFKGPDGLATALVSSGRLEECAVRELFRFAMGRTESADELIELQPMIDAFRARKHGFHDVLLAVTGAKSFGHRFDDSGKGS